MSPPDWRSRNGGRRWGVLPLACVACGAGCLLAAGFPSLNWTFCAFFALVPFFFVMETATGKWLFLLPLGSLTVFFLLLLYWIPRVMVLYGGISWGISLLLYAALCLALAFFYLPTLISFIFIRALRPSLAYLVFPFAWVTCDLVRNFWMVNGFPWGALGYSQIDRLWAQVADVGGIYLVTFLVVAVNAAVAWGWLYRSAALPAVVVSLLLGSAALYGWRATRTEYAPSSLMVGVIQPVVEMNQPDSYLRQKYLFEIPAMVSDLASQGARLVVLPEAPLQFDYYEDPAFAGTLDQLAQRHNVALIFNNTTRNSSGEYFNSMITLRPDGSPGGRYDKIHLVPFGEYVPGARWLSFVHPLVREVAGFSPGSGISLTGWAEVRVGGFICFEAVFPELARKFVAAGAELLVNITNDAWYGRTSAAAQHFQMARMRAIETRRFLVRAANSGISGVVDPSGKVKRQLGLFQQAGFVAGTRPLRPLTFYVRRGDLFAKFSSWVFIAGLLAGRLYRRRAPK